MFWTGGQFPNCIGAFEGKNNIQAAPRSVGLFHNSKGTFSVVLLALADAEHRFSTVQVGDFGRTGDGGTYAGSDLGKGMAENSLCVPSDRPSAIHHGEWQILGTSGILGTSSQRK